MSGFLVVNAQGLMLRGPPNSVAYCVEVLSKRWPLVRALLVLATVSVMSCVVIIAWMKLDEQFGDFVLAAICTSIVGGTVFAAYRRMVRAPVR